MSVTFDPKVYPFRQRCTQCDALIEDEKEAVQVNTGVFEKGTFSPEEYPVYYHPECFDKHFKN